MELDRNQPSGNGLREALAPWFDHSAARLVLLCIALALFDLETPDVCLRRGESWVFGPEAPYERQGDVPNAVFPCGLTIGEDNDTIFLYYGAADTSIALATGSIRKLVLWLAGHGGPLQ